MTNYNDIIKNINNPMADSKFLKDMIKCYFANHMSDDIYKFLDVVYANDFLEEAKQESKDNFFRVLFNTYKSFILNHTDYKYNKIKKYVKNISLTTEEEIRDFFEVGVEDEETDKMIAKFNPLNVEDMETLSLNPKQIFNKDVDDLKEQCRLSLSLSSNLLYKAAGILYARMAELGINGRMEICKTNRAFSNLVIYTDLASVELVNSLINYMLKENEDIAKDLIKPTIFEGNYQDKIGISDVPVTYNKYKKDKKKKSYEVLRAEVVNDVLKDYFNLDRVEKFLSYNYRVNGELMSGKDYFVSLMMNFIIKNLSKEELKNSIDFKLRLFKEISNNLNDIILDYTEGKTHKIILREGSVDLSTGLVGYALSKISNNVLDASPKTVDMLNKKIENKGMDAGIYSGNFYLDRTNMVKANEVSKSSDIEVSEEEKYKIVKIRECWYKKYQEIITSSLSRKKKIDELRDLKETYKRSLKSSPKDFNDIEFMDRIDYKIESLNENIIKRLINRKR